MMVSEKRLLIHDNCVQENLEELILEGSTYNKVKLKPKKMLVSIFFAHILATRIYIYSDL